MKLVATAIMSTFILGTNIAPQHTAALLTVAVGLASIHRSTSSSSSLGTLGMVAPFIIPLGQSHLRNEDSFAIAVPSLLQPWPVFSCSHQRISDESFYAGHPISALYPNPLSVKGLRPAYFPRDFPQSCVSVRTHGFFWGWITMV